MSPKERSVKLDAAWSSIAGPHPMSSPGPACFYPPKPDPEAERHRELMLRLAEMQGLLVDILEELKKR